MEFVAIEIPYAIEPCFPVEIGHVDHQCVALPVAARISQPEVDVAIRVFGGVGVDGTNGMAELEEQSQVARPLEDLERLIAVNTARRSERKALGSRIGRSARGEILRALFERRRSGKELRCLRPLLRQAARLWSQDAAPGRSQPR